MKQVWLCRFKRRVAQLRSGNLAVWTPNDIVEVVWTSSWCLLALLFVACWVLFNFLDFHHSTAACLLHSAWELGDTKELDTIEQLVQCFSLGSMPATASLKYQCKGRLVVLTPSYHLSTSALTISRSITDHRPSILLPRDTELPCWYSSGKKATTDRPCKSGGVSVCCAPGWNCLDNGTCQKVDVNGITNSTGSCTDSNVSRASPDCPLRCGCKYAFRVMNPSL